MAKLNRMFFALTVWLIPACLVTSNFTPFREQLNVLERELQKMRALIPDTGPSSIKQELSKGAGLAHLSGLVQKSVTETFGKMVKDRSMEGMISEHVRGEIRSLKGMVHHLKRQVRSLTQRVTQAESERETMRKNLEKQRKEFSERVNTLEQSLNVSCELFMAAKTSMDVFHKNISVGCEPKTSKYRTKVTQRAHISSVAVTTPSWKPSVVHDESARILVAPFSEVDVTVNQIHLKNNSVQSYPHIVLREVVSVVYMPREKTIYASSRNPKRIVSYRLDRSGMSTVQNNMASSGMTVEGRRYVYFTTFYPHYTVSRMIRGRAIRRVVDLTNCGGYPHSIAVAGSMIYVACDTKLVEMNIFGRVFRDVFTGSYIYAVGIDPDKRVLYFNSDKQVIKMPVLHHRVTRAIAFYPNRTMAISVNSPPHIQKTAKDFTETFELTYIPRNFIVYKNLIYIGSQVGGHVDVLNFGDFESDTVLHELQRLQTATVNIALIPSDRRYGRDRRLIVSRRLSLYNHLRSIKKAQD